MPLKKLHPFSGFLLAAIIFLFACQLPGKIVQSIRQRGTSTALAPSLSPGRSTAQAGIASATPVLVATDTPVLALPASEQAYPGAETPGSGLPSGAVPSLPAQAPLTVQPTVSPSSPAVSPSESPAGSPGVTEAAGVTPFTPGELPTAVNQAGSAMNPYPGIELGQATVPAGSGYPGPELVPTLAAAEGSYPVPGQPAASAVLPTTAVSGQASVTPTSSPPTSATLGATTPTATQTQKPVTDTAVQATLSATSTPTTSPSPVPVLPGPSQSPSPTQVYVLTATPSPTLVFAVPTALLTGEVTRIFPTVELSPTPTATFFVPTETPTPTITPFLTPTPTNTYTPTPTRTPLPVPPWVSVSLHATDPHSVQLAAGKPQLIEFFAFWSGPCLAMAPLVQGIEMEYTGKVNFIFMDIDNPATDIFKQQLHYRVEPHFFLVDAHGKVLQQWVGYVTVQQFRRAIDAALP
jgi:thiol-disulfide isomerase/thioredoxin